jgi:hypothetical protein
MSAESWTQAYRDAWRTFYSYENMKGILERTNDRNYYNVMKNFIWYKNALIEGEHPMITGFFRRKRRLDRRAGFPVESRWAFFKRRTREITHIWKEWVKLYWEMQELWLHTWPQRDRRVQVARECVVRWADIGKSALNPLRWPRAASLTWMRFSLLGRKSLLTRREAVDTVKRHAMYSRRALNAFWAETIHRFRTFAWHRIDVGHTLVNAWREMKVNLWFLAHLASAKRFDAVGRMG